jgi:hypothetical protein
MSLDLQPLAIPDWAPPADHIDDDGDLLAVPADDQPVAWDDDDLYRDER